MDGLVNGFADRKVREWTVGWLAECGRYMGEGLFKEVDMEGCWRKK